MLYKEGKMKKVYLMMLVLATLFIAGCISSGTQNQRNNLNNENNINNNVDETIFTVEITSEGFSPNELTINQGDTVKWINKDSARHWPASAMHPTHTVYPSSDIKKCGTSEQSSIFDACKGLAQGESWSFTFNEKGSWNYHDHLFPGLRGKIIVQ